VPARFAHPAPIAIGGGTGGRQAPGRGCSITRTRTHHHPRTGLHPGPRPRLPWICEEGPGGALVDEKLWMDMPARFAHPCPYRIRGGTGGRQPPRERQNQISRTLTQHAPLPGGCTRLERIAPDMQGGGGPSIFRWENAGWTCRRGLPAIAPEYPLHVRRGKGATQGCHVRSILLRCRRR
jgi:hypothetical protein